MTGRHHRILRSILYAALLVAAAPRSARALPLHEGIADAKTSEARGVQDDQLYFQVGGATINAPPRCGTCSASSARMR